jgi:hypothetical protein
LLLIALPANARSSCRRVAEQPSRPAKGPVENNLRILRRNFARFQDSNGLWLAISKSGSRKWFLRVTVDGKRREMGLGALRDVSLA